MKNHENRLKVLVALSGGVDSSVAATLLVEQGHEVVAASMRLWSEPGSEMENRCCTPETRLQARRQAEKLSIPFYELDATSVFRQEVVNSFLDGYACGQTPNPCLVCNQRVKWGFLLEQACLLGVDAIATGHYARIQHSGQFGLELWRGVDASKDQSYFLSLLTQAQLEHTLFPLGDLRKSQVRTLAREHSLPAAEAPESQDLCFLGGMDYRSFLRKYVPEVVVPGEVVNRNGQVLGEHNGLAFYTIGQRKGLPAADRPMYVLQKNLQTNQLFIGYEEELGRRELSTGQAHWIAGSPPAARFTAQVKIRYKAAPQPAVLWVQPDGSVAARFDATLRDITAGQMAVFYQDDRVLGGGVIQPD